MSTRFGAPAEPFQNAHDVLKSLPSFLTDLGRVTARARLGDLLGLQVEHWFGVGQKAGRNDHDREAYEKFIIAHFDDGLETAQAVLEQFEHGNAELEKS